VKYVLNFARMPRPQREEEDDEEEEGRAVEDSSPPTVVLCPHFQKENSAAPIATCRAKNLSNTVSAPFQMSSRGRGRVQTPARRRAARQRRAVNVAVAAAAVVGPDYGR